ncbi:MAG TPA: hypothetical protein VFU02_00300 [Polyangiaceae bacterium]|nr:hypothetical protein [Polyangiaceae bacterium]
MRQGLVGLSIATLAVACGGESGGNADDTTNQSATAAATGGGATGGGSGGATSSSSQETSNVGTDGSNTASTTGAPIGDCSGPFGEPVELFTAELTAPQSFALTPDELELYYVDYPDQVRRVHRRVRSSRTSSFGPPEAVPELVDLCPSVSAELVVGTIDLSPDGLVAYIACEETVELPTTLVTATRSALGAPFVPDTAPLGTVGASFATADGLEAFANTPTGLDMLDRHRRDSLTVPFGQAERLPIQLRGPDPSNDGLWLFGSLPVAGTDPVQYHLAATVRTDRSAPFGEPTLEGFPSPPAGFSDFTPTISADCRSLYFLRYGASPFSVMVSRR